MITLQQYFDTKLQQLQQAFDSGQISEQEYESGRDYYTSQYDFYLHWNMKFGDYPFN